MRRSTWPYWLLFIVPAACGDQAPPTYQGEALAVVQGTIVSHLTDPLPEADLVLGWSDWTGQTPDLGPHEVPFGSFTRVQVAPTFPASFRAEVFQPPPESAYQPLPTTGPTLLGPRFTDALIILAKRGAAVTETTFNSGDGSVLMSFDQYTLRYVDSDGLLSARDDQGVIHPIQQLTKGFHLIQNDPIFCSNGVDQACLDQARAFNLTATGSATLSDWDVYRCSMVQEKGNSAEVPLGSPITLTIPAADAPPPAFSPCSPPAN